MHGSEALMKTHNKLEDCWKQGAVQSVVCYILYFCYLHQKVFLDGVNLYPALAENNNCLQSHSNCLSLVRYVPSGSRNNDPVKSLTKGFLSPHECFPAGFPYFSVSEAVSICCYVH